MSVSGYKVTVTTSVTLTAAQVLKTLECTHHLQNVPATHTFRYSRPNTGYQTIHRCPS